MHICTGTWSETSSYPYSCIYAYMAGKAIIAGKKKTNYCHNISCYSHGVCRSLTGTYKCECFGGMYYGDNCEFTTKKNYYYSICCKIFGLCCHSCNGFCGKIYYCYGYFEIWFRY